MFNRDATLPRYPSIGSEYDFFIPASPVWGGRLAAPMRAFAPKERERIPHHFFITLCNGLGGHKEKLTAKISSLVQKEPLGVAELWINRLLPEGQRNKIKHAFNDQVGGEHFTGLKKKSKHLSVRCSANPHDHCASLLPHCL